MNDPLWTENVKILFRNDRLKEFWPCERYSLNENINAVTRFCLYAGVMMSTAKNDYIYVLGALICVIILALFVKPYMKETNPHVVRSTNPKYFKMTEEKCQKPTKSNPFANALVTDTIDNPEKLQACPYDEVKTEINDAFMQGFVHDPYDIYNKKHGQRQFYSTANTQIPNDQAKFAQWLYGNANATCKENGVMCTGRDQVN